MTPRAHPSPRSDRIAAQQNRDAAFARITRVRGASVVGAGALTAGVALVVSAIAPGHTLGAKAAAHASVTTSPRVSRSRPTGGDRLPPLASARQLGLRAPDSAPGPAPQSSQSAPTPQQSSPAPQQSAPAPQQSSPAPQQSAPAPQQSAPAPSGAVTSGGS
jgi:hypothetical protein